MPDIAITCIISGEETGGAVAVFEEITAPGAGPPLHRHLLQGELFHVIEGTYRFTRGEEVVEAGPGASLFIPANVAHRFENIGSTPGKLHFELMPALKSEEGFAKMMTQDPATMDMPAFFAEYDMELVNS